MGLLSNPRREHKLSAGTIIGLLMFAYLIGYIVWRNWPHDETPAQAQAVAMPSETPSPTFTPTPTRNVIIETVQAGQLEVIAMEKLNLAAAGTLQVEESNQRQRHAEQLLADKRTQEAISAAYTYTSTQQADMMSINAKLEENETARQIAIERHQLTLVLVIIGFAIVTGIILAVVVEVGRRALALWDAAGEPEQPEQVYEIVEGNTIRRPLAGDICTNRELTIIAGTWKRLHSLTVRELEAGGLPSERWGDTKKQDGTIIEGIRTKMLFRGLLELENPKAAQSTAVPTDEGELLFEKVIQ